MRCFFILLLALSLSAPCTSIAQTADEDYEATLEQLQQLYTTQQAGEYILMYQAKFREKDTLDETGRDRYVYYGFCLAEMQALRKDTTGAISTLERIANRNEFDYWAEVLGDVLFDFIPPRKPVGDVVGQFPKNEKEERWFAMLDKAYEKLGFPDNKSWALKVMAATDRTNDQFNDNDSSKHQYYLVRLLNLSDWFIARNGYPSSKVYGDQSKVIARILAKAPLETQKKHQKLLLDESLKGNIPDGAAAALLDKIALAEKGKQIYGTQYRELAGKPSFYPIEDPKNIEARRKKLGFKMSWKDYKRSVELGRI